MDLYDSDEEEFLQLAAPSQEVNESLTKKRFFVHKQFNKVDLKNVNGCPGPKVDPDMHSQRLGANLKIPIPSELKSKVEAKNNYAVRGYPHQYPGCRV